ncbi:MAG TPA: class I SAM-dependent methyltransferase [Anaeromyxobacter sp.]
MKRNETHEPTIERVIELSGIETLHPGGMAMTRRTAEVAALAPGMQLLDVSSGRGTQAIYYAQQFGVEVSGVDISDEMVRTASRNAAHAGVADRVRFRQGDSQQLPFSSGTFDVVVNECAVGIPEDSQAVLDEMLRVVRPGGIVVMHESTWRASLPAEEKDELADRYGTTPLESAEWIEMLGRAGARDIRAEADPWSRPEMFWKVRVDRDVRRPGAVLTPVEKARTVLRVARRYGLAGVRKAFENERAFFRAVLDGKLGYSLYWGRRPAA